LPGQGDFLVDGKLTFEIGGRNKTPNQLKGINNAYLALDDIEPAVVTGFRSGCSDFFTDKQL